MFDGIVAAPGRCAHCQKQRWLASIPPNRDGPAEGWLGDGGAVQLCAGCIYKLTRLAGLLLKLEVAPKKKAPKKAAKVPRRPQTAPPVGPFDHDELDPAGGIGARTP